MTGIDYWREHWATLSHLSPNAISGRSAYDAPHVEILVADAVNALALKPGDSLLDIGCAAGLMGEHLTQRCDYTGVDYIETTVQVFHDRCPEVNAMVASALALPFRDGAFTKSLMSSVLLCLSRDECLTALKEMRRVTRERGFCSGNLIGPQPSAERCPPKCRCHAHCTWFEPADLEALAIKAGWARAETRDMDGALQHAGLMKDMVLYC